MEPIPNPTQPPPKPTQLEVEVRNRYFNQIGKTCREIGALLKIHRSWVLMIEKEALLKVQLALTSTPANTHLLAHEPGIKEIDRLFETQPWIEWLRLPSAEGSRTVRFISRVEWEKSRV